MNRRQTERVGNGRPRAWRDYLELTKPRVTSMVLVTTGIGYHLGAAGRFSLMALLFTLVGTSLVASYPG